MEVLAPVHPLVASMPMILHRGGEDMARCAVEFFEARLRNGNTIDAYRRGLSQFFEWVERQGIRELGDIQTLDVAAYIKQHPLAPPTVNMHLSAIRGFFRWFVEEGKLDSDPAKAVRRLKNVVERGKTPAISKEEAHRLLASLPLNHVIEFRDRAIMGVLLYSWARISATLDMNGRDFYLDQGHWWISFTDKGSKKRHLPLNRTAARYLREYLKRAGIRDEPDAPLFRPTDGKGEVTPDGRLERTNVRRRIKNWARLAGIDPKKVSCHGLRATGITCFLESGGSLDRAQKIAGHRDSRTTQLYDRRDDSVKIEEMNRIEY